MQGLKKIVSLEIHEHYLFESDLDQRVNAILSVYTDVSKEAEELAKKIVDDAGIDLNNLEPDNVYYEYFDFIGLLSKKDNFKMPERQLAKVLYSFLERKNQVDIPYFGKEDYSRGYQRFLFDVDSEQNLGVNYFFRNLRSEGVDVYNVHVQAIISQICLMTLNRSLTELSLLISSNRLLLDKSICSIESIKHLPENYREIVMASAKYFESLGSELLTKWVSRIQKGENQEFSELCLSDGSRLIITNCFHVEGDVEQGFDDLVFPDERQVLGRGFYRKARPGYLISLDGQTQESVMLKCEDFNSWVGAEFREFDHPNIQYGEYVYSYDKYGFMKTYVIVKPACLLSDERVLALFKSDSKMPLKLIEDIVTGVNFLHKERHLLHNDLKFDNVLFDLKIMRAILIDLDSSDKNSDDGVEWACNERNELGVELKNTDVIFQDIEMENQYYEVRFLGRIFSRLLESWTGHISSSVAEKIKTLIASINSFQILDTDMLLCQIKSFSV
jgi:hypothetical protein